MTQRKLDLHNADACVLVSVVYALHMVNIYLQ